MNNLFIEQYTEEQLSKIGNTIIYLIEKIGDMSKTKLFKLLYILDEISIKKSGVPFINLKYKVWKFGPVSEELFIDFSSEITLLGSYVEKVPVQERFKAKRSFCDDEFSENDIQLMNKVISTFGSSTAKELIQYTHRENSPWYIAAKENDVLDRLESETIGTTNILLDMSIIVRHDPRKKDIYDDYVQFH